MTNTTKKHEKHEGDETIMFEQKRCSDDKARKALIAPKAREPQGAGEGRCKYIRAKYYLGGK